MYCLSCHRCAPLRSVSVFSVPSHWAIKTRANSAFDLPAVVCLGSATLMSVRMEASKTQVKAYSCHGQILPLPLHLPRTSLLKSSEGLCQPALFISLHTLVHRFCRVPGRSCDLGLGKDVEPVSPSQQLFLNAFPVLTTRFQIGVAQGDATSP